VLVLVFVLGVLPVRCSGLVRARFEPFGRIRTSASPNIGDEKEHLHELDIEHEDRHGNDHG
jgi:hypothetical protein